MELNMELPEEDRLDVGETESYFQLSSVEGKVCGYVYVDMCICMCICYVCRPNPIWCTNWMCLCLCGGMYVYVRSLHMCICFLCFYFFVSMHIILCDIAFDVRAETQLKKRKNNS